MDSILSTLLYWRSKQPQDNAWHPFPGANPIQPKNIENLPTWITRLDAGAACVDTAPFIAGIGALVHLSQLNDFGFTARASVFSNPKTLLAIHRTTLLVAPLVLACQGLGVEYRYAIPRWASERERRRDEGEVRGHVDFGMYGAMGVWLVRFYALRWGRAYWAPVDVVLGGALADLMHREYQRAHGL